MGESERVLRMRDAYCEGIEDYSKIKEEDTLLAQRIFDLLNDARLNIYNTVDTEYYDFSVLPENVRGQFYRDMYLLYGITDQGEFITKWVERYDLDCNDPIANGKVIREMDK